MEDSIFEVEYRPGEEVVLRLRTPSFEDFSDSTKKHVLSAKKEVLMAVRNVLDKAIEKTEHQQTKTKTKKRKTKIEVK